MIIECESPTRIDLAGGTIDIWPLYLFHEDALTINLAIDQGALTRIEVRDDKRIVIESKDRNERIEADSLEGLKDTRDLRLITKLVRFYKPDQGINLTTECRVPQGSGLGGSTSLNISINGALNYLTGETYSREEIIGIAKNIEAQVIGVPTGEQDFYPAMYGSLNAIWLKLDGIKVESLKADIRGLENRLVLCYTGLQRFSGTNNWEIMKRHIDGEEDVFNRLERIKNTAIKMRSALIERDFKKTGMLIGEEWDNRKGLSGNVSTDMIERLIHAALEKGAISAKVCGAGGGGCIVLFTEEGSKGDVEEELQKRGGRVIDFKIADEGMAIRIL